MLETISREMIDSAIDNAPVELDLVESYSGRAMYGDTCFGVICSSARAYTLFLLQVSLEDFDLAETLALEARSDNMGRDMIYYFPGLKLGA